ncbi:MAG: MarR family winged helix-turn-helix transcriptional regulator [Chloroflexota bacterium]|jgi:MarR family transcriptional regulator, organic hydroperoxide resistance regulator
MQNITGKPDESHRREAVEGLIAELGQTLAELKCVSSQRLVKLGVSMAHLHVLTMLRHHGAMPMSRIAELLDVSFSNATGIVDRLEERGYVERVRFPDDRRVVLVRQTDAADRLLGDVDVLRSDLIGAVLERLDDDQLARVRQAVVDISAAVEAELTSAPEKYTLLRDHAHSHPRSGATTAPATAAITSPPLPTGVAG